MSSRVVWAIWILGVVALSVWLAIPLITQQDQEMFLAGAATHGHHQIGMACTACHTSPFGGKEVLQEACVACHGVELKAVSDSHPEKKFTDPRNADRIERLDARYCVSCHVEHQLERTRAMGVTQPDDFCYECHREIGEERESHVGLGFETCASAGCHNFHDNLALYENFLLKHAIDPWLLETQTPLIRIASPSVAVDLVPDYSEAGTRDGTIVDDWQHSAHARADVNCSACHGEGAERVEKPATAVCADCHVAQTESFQAGKHGMRLAQGLSPMTVASARIAMKPESDHRTLDCASCHQPHALDTRQAAVQACQSCHDSPHSNLYSASPHAQLEAPVTCATCHMPRHTDGKGAVVVNHNQSENLRPNEKMLRSVCMDCHGLAFAIDALADRDLINRNFSGRPAVHVESIEMAVERANNAPVLDDSYQ